MKINCCEGFIDIIPEVLKNILPTSNTFPNQPYGSSYTTLCSKLSHLTNDVFHDLL
jgi:hypothetical protein